MPRPFMRKVLGEGIDSDDAFANKLADGRYKALVESLNFARHGEAATGFERAQKGVAEKYTRQTLEQESRRGKHRRAAGASISSRMAPTIANGYEIIADEALSSVVRTVLQLPAEFAPPMWIARRRPTRRRSISRISRTLQKQPSFLGPLTALWESTILPAAMTACGFRARRAATEFLPTCF
ncbi:DUF1217 domain-containing protein [Sinorhizobium meliloti]|nr:DUF1217 domain-containing protein [Sinorhizobium meliloti]